MSSIDTDHDSSNSVVIKSSDFVNPLFSDTISAKYFQIEIDIPRECECFQPYLKKHNDAKDIVLLQKYTITPNKIKYDKSMMVIPEMLCTKMELLDFPPDTYILNVAYNNVKSSINNTFDFTNKITEAIHRLNAMQTRIFEKKENGKECLDNIPKDIKFLYIGNSDLVSLSCNKLNKLNNVHYVKLHGYFLEDTNWKYDERIIKLYSNNLSLVEMNYVTPFADFYFEYSQSIPRPDEIIFTIYVDSHKYIELTYGDIKKKIEQDPFRRYPYSEFLRIPFTEFDEKYKWSVLRFDLPEEVTKNSLNFGRVGHMFLVTNYITIKKIEQWRYIKYLYPDMLCRYSDVE
jgi:hypothetical protein